MGNNMDNKDNKKQDADKMRQIKESVEMSEQESSKIPTATFSHDEKWVKEYIEQFGEEPSFF